MPAEIDFNTAAWLQVARWAQSRLDALRLRNDALLDPVETASLRGRIQELKELIGLPERVARENGTESAGRSSFGDDWPSPAI
jgi:hypothetical protein